MNGPTTPPERTRAYEVIGDSRDRAEWLKQRASGIGASEMPAIMGRSRFDSALSVYARKVGALVDESDEPPSEAAYWGLRLEQVIAEEFSRRTGIAHRMHGELVRSTVHPWALATLDAVTEDDRNLEIKTASQYLAEDWRDGAPEAYRIQAHQQMLVTDSDRCRIACLIGGQQFVWTEVTRDERLILDIVLAGREFWERVNDQRPPEPDGSDASRDALQALYGEHAGDVELPEHFTELDAERETLRAQKSLAEKRIRELDHQIIAAIGHAERGTLANGMAFQLKTVSRDAYTVNASTYTLIQRQDLTTPRKKGRGRHVATH